jgi:hypothetical protein
MRAGAAFPRRGRPRFRFNLASEALELRQLLSTVAPVADLSQIKAQPSLQATPMVSAGPTGLTPQQVAAAYGINQVAFSGGTVPGNGSGQTIAIVTAYNDPNIRSDLAAFDSYYKIQNPNFAVANLGGSATDAGWALETSLDVEWAHAVAPGANILVVEAASANFSDLLNAVNYAKAQPGVSVVSMSWGGNEFWGESSYDSTFTTPSGHTGVAFVAASGDSGAWSGPSYPAVSPNVLAVGGTTLRLNTNSTYSSESGWIGSTGGFSGYDMNWWYYEAAPSYQVAAQRAVGLSYGVRTTPDVSFNADPNSGVPVFDSVPYNGQAGWYQVGGTSAGAPAWAGLVAIADQGLATGGKGPLTTAQLQSQLYSLPSSDFHDITSGFNGYRASTGYDLVTGLGTPNANLLVPGLLAANGVSLQAAAHVTSSTTHAATTVTASRFDLTVTVSNAAGSGAAAAAVTTESASQVAGALPVQALTTQAAPTLAVAQPTVQAPSAATSVGSGLVASAPAQSLLPQSAWRNTSSGDRDAESSPMVDAVDTGQPAVPKADEAPAPDQVPAPAPEKVPDAPPAMPAEPAADPTLDDFDEALDQVSWVFAARRLELPPALLDEIAPVREDQPGWSMSALAGAVAVAAGGYRLVLGRADRIRRPWRPWRFS